MDKCSGPCLPYCFNKGVFFYITIGMVLGFLLFLNIQKNKKNNKII